MFHTLKKVPNACFASNGSWTSCARSVLTPDNDATKLMHSMIDDRVIDVKPHSSPAPRNDLKIRFHRSMRALSVKSFTVRL